jgi:Domain of unknown function (DUF5666)
MCQAIIFKTIVVTLLISAGIGLGSSLEAQTAAAPATVRGKVTARKGTEVIISTPAGAVKAVLTDKTVIRVEEPIQLSQITAGMYLGTTATKQPDGNFLASEVHVFSEDQRGTGEGHRPLGSAPQSGATMTNANVERVEEVAVQDIKGRMMTLKYKGGEVKVIVPPNIPIVNRVVRDTGALKTGQEVSLQGSRNADGSLSATQITVRAAGR